MNDVTEPFAGKRSGNGRVTESRILSDIEGGNICNVRKLADDHFSMEMRPDVPSVYTYPDHHVYWFYFGVRGAGGREICFDIVNCDWMPRHWKKYRPVFSCAPDPDSQAAEWHRIDRTAFKGNTFSFIQKFEREHVWVALRYPYTCTREKRFIETIEGRDHVRIETIGVTSGGKPLHMIVVTDQNTPARKKKGVLVYAREHGVEQDGSWVVEGMIDFLISPEYAAEKLRRHCVFMLVLNISPDAAAAGRAVDPENGSHPGIELMKRGGVSAEASCLYRYITEFVRDGNTLDISISLHNPHGTEPNIYPHFRPFNNKDSLKKAKMLHKAVLNNRDMYTKWKSFVMKSCAYSVGTFARDFGSNSILYEVNHQAKDNYLSLQELKGIGRVMLTGLFDYYDMV